MGSQISHLSAFLLLGPRERLEGSRECWGDVGPACLECVFLCFSVLYIWECTPMKLAALAPSNEEEMQFSR